MLGTLQSYTFRLSLAMPRLLCFIQYHWASRVLGTLVSRYSFVDSCEGVSGHVRWLSGTLQTRSSLLARVPPSRSKILARMPLYTYVDSRDDAQSTGARSTIFEFHVLVSPEVVRVCRYCVYCAGSPPPGTVICAVFNSCRLVRLLP